MDWDERSISAGADIKMLQNQLGHRSATLTLDLNGHLYPDELDAFTAALDAHRTDALADSLRTALPATRVVSLSDRR